MSTKELWVQAEGKHFLHMPGFTPLTSPTHAYLYYFILPLRTPKVETPLLTAKCQLALRSVGSSWVCCFFKTSPFLHLPVLAITTHNTKGSSITNYRLLILTLMVIIIVTAFSFFLKKCHAGCQLGWFAQSVRVRLMKLPRLIQSHMEISFTGKF